MYRCYHVNFIPVAVHVALSLPTVVYLFKLKQAGKGSTIADIQVFKEISRKLKRCIQYNKYILDNIIGVYRIVDIFRGANFHGFYGL